MTRTCTHTGCAKPRLRGETLCATHYAEARMRDFTAIIEGPAGTRETSVRAVSYADAMNAARSLLLVDEFVRGIL